MSPDLLKPSHLKELCAKYGFAPSKAYGQNYLISSRPIEKMIEAAELGPEDTVIEIGPGFGVLTLAVAPLVEKVIAFEIERQLGEYWAGKEREYPNVEIVWGNALEQVKRYEACGELAESIGDRRPVVSLSNPYKKYKVLANLPYQITSNALRTILELTPAPERVVVMVQKEVAERICAKAGDMSLLGVSVQYYGEPKTVASVSRGSFWPSPKVDSAVVLIRNIHEQPDAEVFFRVVRAGFAHKRKQLWHNLADGLGLPGDRVKEVLRSIIGNEKIRAEDVGVGDWRKIVALLCHPDRSPA